MTFATWPDLIGTLIAALLTLLVLSYIIGDNPLFRVTIYLFIGVSAGFAGAVAFRSILIPHLFKPLWALLMGDFSTASLLNLVPILLSLLLLAKLSQSVAHLGNVPMAYLAGIGAAVAIGGAIFGTLFPQSLAAMNLLDLETMSDTSGLNWATGFLNRLILLGGTLATIIYFQFSAKRIPNAPPQRPDWIEWIARVGQGFIAITFGATFAGVFAAAMTALVERVQFLWILLRSFF